MSAKRERAGRAREMRGSTHFPGSATHLVLLAEGGQAEVSELQVSLLRPQKVLWLDVPVHDAVQVALHHASQGTPQHARDPSLRVPSVPAPFLARKVGGGQQGPPRAQLQDEVDGSRVLEGLVGVRHVEALAEAEVCPKLRLNLDPVQAGAAGEVPGPLLHGLHCDDLSCRLAEGLPNHTVPTLAHRPPHVVSVLQAFAKAITIITNFG
mmetsp:Transcript_8003/g.27484  ORF Transcript_8003/g.27484 Transcript_8003/m.27484 type:complete len:209 (+) Transcript_8003:1121-1747(+)